MKKSAADPHVNTVCVEHNIERPFHWWDIDKEVLSGSGKRSMMYLHKKQPDTLAVVATYNFISKPFKAIGIRQVSMGLTRMYCFYFLLTKSQKSQVVVLHFYFPPPAYISIHICPSFSHIYQKIFLAHCSLQCNNNNSVSWCAMNPNPTLKR